MRTLRELTFQLAIFIEGTEVPRVFSDKGPGLGRKTP
jgi:hypothetical protein